MSDNSPLFQRKIRRKAPVITTSQDSPVRPPSKKTVPPSPGLGSDTSPPTVQPSSDPATPSHDVPSPKPKRARKRNGRSKKHVSRRQQMLGNIFLDLQAVECDSGGASVKGSQNSEDDMCVLPSPPPPPLFQLCNSTNTNCTFRHLTDLSYVTNGSYSDGDRAMYVASLTSQGDRLGFGTPLHLKRRGEFK